MKKAIGITILLVAICAATTYKQPNFLSAENVQNNISWSALFGILAIGSAFVIISGGIDLSIGSVVCLIGCLLSLLLNGWHIHTTWFGWEIDVTLQLSVWPALLVVLAVAALIGLLHGLLITKLRLQSFIVTLCGLLIYRGVSRWLTGEETQGFGADELESFREVTVGTYHSPRLATTLADLVQRIPGLDNLGPGWEDFKLPIPFFFVVALGLLAGGFLHWTVYGRYLLALGRNEQAARYSGINTDRMVILAYVLCSLIAGLGGILLALDINSVQPSSFGVGWEMYAIAAAVLGGCSLRGGEGSILGVIVGTALIRVILNATSLLGIPDTLAEATTGVVILGGVIADEIMHRVAARRRLRSE